MNPIYKFELTVNGTTERAYPIYNNELSLSFEKETGQEFFRRKLSGELEFQSVDYRRIVSAAFDTRFGLVIFISYDAGVTWLTYWSGEFWKTDCKFDADTETVTVTPFVKDQYTAVLAGIEKEYNLIDLAPEITPVIADKRPMIQVYVPGQTVIACFLSGMWWEQECEAENDTEKLTRVGDGNLNFALNRAVRVVEVTGPSSLPQVFTGNPFSEIDPGNPRYTSADYIFSYYYNAESGGSTAQWDIIRASDNVTLWQYKLTNRVPPTAPYTVTLSPVAGTGASGNVSLYIHDIEVYARYLLDVDVISGVNTFLLSPTDDIVPNNRNYRRAIGYAVSNVIWISTLLTETPTKWGIYQPGRYYLAPYSPYYDEFFPIARQSWGRVSVWFCFSAIDEFLERSGRAPFVLRDAYPLASVISVLLGKIAPGVTHNATTEYSQFLYGANPLTGGEQTLLVTPKSNVVSAGYDQPAQKAPVTLKNVMDMLRDCFRCYWFVDEQNRLRIEHISYFMSGGTYSGDPVVGIDLTLEQVSRIGKPWAFAKNQYSFDKPDMAARYQFGWMDDVTQPFEGYPIDIISGFVNSDLIEDITISKFTSDIDYILLNPSAVSKDGFALLAAVKGPRSAGEYAIKQGRLAASEPIGATYAQMLKSSSTRISTGLIEVRGQIRIVNNSANHKYYIFGFDDNGNYNGSSGGWYTGSRVFANPVGSTKIALTIAYTDDSAIGPSEMPWDMYILDESLILPYYDTEEKSLQNGYVSFDYLQRFYAYDMPAPVYDINEVRKIALGVKKLRTQSLSFPVLRDPDLVKLIRTLIGDGMIDKISVNLSSREANATLKYDTE